MVVQHGHLPKNPTNDAEFAHWREWVQDASPSEVFEAFLTRMSHSRIGQPALEPVQMLLVNRLREQLQGGR